MTTDPMRPDAITGSYVPRVRSTVAHVQLDGEAVIYDEVTNQVHVLNPTASLVWSVLDGRSTVGEIAADISEAFGADPDLVLRDVLDLTRELGGQGLLAGVIGERDGDHAESSERAGEAADAAEDDSQGSGQPRFLEDPPST